ncbi:hypothetical protein [Halorubrum tibetense]|uniref:Uncharacterized protein n=1 Tax=Halorubrum tibetense TaxID=175631 RepID=A0ABD5S7E6_9EURY
MSILSRLLGGESSDNDTCCDLQIKEVDADETTEDASNEGGNRAED